MTATPPAHPDLIAEIAAFCEARGVARSAFGMNAIGDPSLVNQLEGGRELRRRTVEAIRRYMVTGIPRHARREAAE